MGHYDGGESTDIVGLYLLSKIQHLPLDTGKFRDDGIAISHLSASETDDLKEEMCAIYKAYGLTLDIRVNVSVVDYLDVTLDISTGNYAPYMKPGDTKHYVSKFSNHPPSVLKNIPRSINDRLCRLSSNQELFESAIPPYQKALSEAGYDHKLSYYHINNSGGGRKKARTRSRNCVYFNPPFSLNVKTNVLGQFLEIVRNFPKNNILAPIITTNLIKCSYRTVPNMAKQVARKNGRILKTKVAPTPPKCNCQPCRKHECPLPGKCTISDICYCCAVTREDNNTVNRYAGQTVQTIKARSKQHKSDANKYAEKLATQHQTQQHSDNNKKTSRLSKHIGTLLHQNIPHHLDWSVLARAAPHDPVTGWCQLCNVEKWFIMFRPEFADLNLRTELFGWCLHKTRNLLIYEPT